MEDGNIRRLSIKGGVKLSVISKTIIDFYCRFRVFHRSKHQVTILKTQLKPGLFTYLFTVNVAINSVFQITLSMDKSIHLPL